MSTRFNRRAFVKRSAFAASAAAVAWQGAPALLADASPNAKLQIAGIGVGGQGGSHVGSALREHLVAIADVVDGSLERCSQRVAKHYQEQKIDRPLPARFFDYRKMLDKLGDKIDAVFVATPDHHHAPASIRAMKLGKHVYCEKPLTHDIDEARQMALVAKQRNVATQMGNQGRAEEGWRLLCEWIWAGVIGQVQEVHVWTDRPGIPARFWWPQGGGRPAGADPIPAGLQWDIWLGAAPERPYLDAYKDGPFKGKRVYQPFVWRGWRDFGTGALGDIGCHAMSGIYTALRIAGAASVELVQDAGNGTDEMFPSASVIRWDIPARGDMAACKLFWYDGALYPPREVCELPADKPFPDNGAVVVGSAGKLAIHGHTPRLLPEAKMKDFVMPPKTLPRCASNHFDEWVTACKGGRAAFSNFVDHAGPLTEFVLLGNLAIAAGVGKPVQWDAAAMKCINRPELDRLVRRPHRAGWEL